MPLRCVIVDDNARFLSASSTILGQEGLIVVGVASTSAEARQRARELRPDVVLVDIELGTESGFDVARQLVGDGGDGRPAIILISTHAEADFADLIAESPAAGFLSKTELSAEAIRRVLDGAST